MATTTRKAAAAKPAPAPEGDQEGTLAASQAAPAPEPAPADPGPATSVLDGLQRLRAPFPDEAVGKLPRGTCKACKEVGPWRSCDRHAMVRGCDLCGQTHSTATMHLDYVGHADLTDRLLSVDPEWSWRPFTQEEVLALPPVMRDAGLWIMLTVCGVTRPGFGDGGNKRGGDMVKEAIGDALRNAGMRFGAALYLWAKGDRSWAVKDETPEDTVADPAAHRQGTSDDPTPAASEAGRGDGTTGSVHHARVVQVNAMAPGDLPENERPRWRTHLGAFQDTFATLTPEEQTQARSAWPFAGPPDSLSVDDLGKAREWVTGLKGQDALTPQ